MQLLTLMTNLQSGRSSLDTRHTWFQPPVRFEDAIGEVIPFARECDLHVSQQRALAIKGLNTDLKKDLKSLIRSRFEPRTGRDPRPGYDKVLAEEYELFDSDESTLHITEANLGTIASRNGVTMAFIVGQFRIDPFQLDQCPKPGCRSTRLSQLQAGGKLW